MAITGKIFSVGERKAEERGERREEEDVDVGASTAKFPSNSVTPPLLQSGAAKTSCENSSTAK